MKYLVVLFTEQRDTLTMANIASIMEEKHYVPTTELDVRYHYNVTRDAYSLSDHSSVTPESESSVRYRLNDIEIYPTRKLTNDPLPFISNLTYRIATIFQRSSTTLSMVFRK